MIKLIDILNEIESNKILIPRRSEERDKKYIDILNQKIQQYIKDGGKGDLDLSNTPITSLPNNLKVGESLNLSNTPITSLPDNLQVGESLNLYSTQITSLPKNLKVGKNLDLSYTPIISLPDNLQVEGDLDLSNTPITSFPDNLQVIGFLFLYDTPLDKLRQEELRKMIEDKGGRVGMRILS